MVKAACESCIFPGVETQRFIEPPGTDVAGAHFQPEGDSLERPVVIEVFEKAFADALVAGRWRDEHLVDEEQGTPEFIASVGDQKGIAHERAARLEQDDAAAGRMSIVVTVNESAFPICWFDSR